MIDELVLKTKVPKEWFLGASDPLDRLKAAGIVLLNDDGTKVTSLLSPIDKA